MPKPKDFNKIWIAGTEVSHRKSEFGTPNSENGSQIFFSVGLSGNKTTSLVGVNIEKNWNPFQFDEIKIFHKLINVKYVNKPTKLRIPSSVQKRLNAVNSEQKQEEQKMVRALLAKENGEPTRQCFKTPIRSVTVSKFASSRELPSGRIYYHSGVDFRAATGNKVYASNDGTVAYVGEFTVPGKFIAIDHGGGIYTKYLHLSEWDVEIGQKIKKGQLIGRSGATGRVEAPHLHWEIVWKGIPVDPLLFLSQQEQTCDPS